MSTSSETWQLGSQTVQVSHLEKCYWPQTGFTKGEMLDYYRRIAHTALPYFKDRPVTLRMFPEGVSGEAYYLRDCPEAAPDWLRRGPPPPPHARGPGLFSPARTSTGPSMLCCTGCTLNHH